MDSLNKLSAKGQSRRSTEDVFLQYVTRITSEISSLNDQLDDLDGNVAAVVESFKSSF